MEGVNVGIDKIVGHLWVEYLKSHSGGYYGGGIPWEDWWVVE